MTERRSIWVSEEVSRAIEAHLADLGATSLEEAVEAILRERLRAAGHLSPYSPEEEKAVEEHLRALGYLD